MKTAIVLFVAAFSIAPCAHALDARLRGQFEKLDPQTRLEQRCDLEAMNRIKAAKLGYRPDKVIAYSFGDPSTAENMLKAKGAVFRSEGEWYRLAFKCETTPDRLDVTAFKFRIGEKVQRQDWAAHYLYD